MDSENALQEYWLQSNNTEIIEEAFFKVEDSIFVELIEKESFSYNLYKYVNLDALNTDE